MSYGTLAGVAAYTKHATNTSGTFDATTQPTADEVQAFLDRLSARVNGWLAMNGYVVPVVNADAAAALDEFVNLGGAGLVELSQRVGGYSSDDPNRRENKFLAQFEEVRGFIASGALANLGAAQSRTPSPIFGLAVGGKTAGGQPLKPIFTRTSFNNNPTAESGSEEYP